MNCVQGVLADPIFIGSAAASAIAALVMILTTRFQEFPGKRFLAITYLGVICTLLCVGLEGASTSAECQMQWAMLAWFGNVLVPIAWCFFVFAYVEATDWTRSRKTDLVLVVAPSLGLLLAMTNPWHGLIYTDASGMQAETGRVRFVHGPAFYLVIGSVYLFVMATLFCIVRALRRARRTVLPLLAMLSVITLTPLIANVGYIVFDLTVFGMDPTAFMFMIGILSFTGMIVTDRKMDMASIGRSLLFDTMSEPVVLFDSNRQIVLCNTAAKKNGLCTTNGSPLHDLTTGFGDLGQADADGHIEIGTRIYEPRVQSVENPLNPGGAKLGWSVTYVDVTERVATNRALQDALVEADKANRAKDDFISVVSHELRTPLTSLKGGLALALSGRLGDLNPQINSALSIAHRNGIRLSRLVDNILLAQKIELGAVSLNSEELDMARLLEESIEENRMFAEERGIRVVKSAEEIPGLVRGDAFAIRQIIDNVLANAIKFSERDGVVSGVLTLVRDEGLRLSITDSGRGIPQGMQDIVFGRFQQVADDGQGATQGSGLGMHIARKLARQMNGELSYESVPGQGATFHLDFPIIAADLTDERRLAG
ncbi:Signal transduction histidine kinase [Roseivivax halotolerans]|uniref:histidine kinase n=1 Tax=Roseivivax halotolerans TaxID=93684 RepID=A0A1I6A8U2_9RHOB|nr:histidine kinase N-terminal 7TM domain-containing protein [Roseivivax halotolerans]SFQ64997.1 Signal transduction histidine kinase [Roseivivax halotolerans]